MRPDIKIETDAVDINRIIKKIGFIGAETAEKPDVVYRTPKTFHCYMHRIPQRFGLVIALPVTIKLKAGFTEFVVSAQGVRAQK